MRTWERGRPARIRLLKQLSIPERYRCAGLLVGILVIAAPATAVAATNTAPLADAAERLDAAALERLLAAPPSSEAINATQVDGMTALHWAVYHDRLDLVRRLLDAGADASAANRYGVSPLSLACANGNAEVASALLAAGAEPNAVLPGGETVFMTAARTGRIEVVEALYEAGADVHFREPKRGQTALMWAAAEGNLEVVELLLEVGADPNAVLDSGFTPLLFAVREGRIEVMEALLRAGVDVNGATPRKAVKRDRPLPGGRSVRPSSTPLLVAVTNGHFELAALVADTDLMRVLAELGADPLTRTDDGSTALMAAAGLGTRSPGEDAGTEEEVLEAVRTALELGADINAVNDDGETPMHGAAYKNLPRVVRLLAENGADLRVWNQRNKYGWTPLTIARGYRFGNFKPSPVTVAAIETIMLAEGVRLPTEEEEGAKAVDIYAKPPPRPPADEPKKDEAKKPPAN